MNILDAPAYNIGGFLWETHVFLPLGWIGLFGTKWAFLHCENYGFQEVFLSKTNSILTGKKMLNAAASNMDGFLWSDRWVSSTQLKVHEGSKQSLCPLWTT
jgi:hypothetical protein